MSLILWKPTTWQWNLTLILSFRCHQFFCCKTTIDLAMPRLPFLETNSTAKSASTTLANGTWLSNSLEMSCWNLSSLHRTCMTKSLIESMHALHYFSWQTPFMILSTKGYWSRHRSSYNSSLLIQQILRYLKQYSSQDTSYQHCSPCLTIRKEIYASNSHPLNLPTITNELLVLMAALTASSPFFNTKRTTAQM